MTSKQVLFICVHNSARSQMAEAFLEKYGAGRFAAESAGLEPGSLNPLAVAVMAEAGIDISRKTTQSAFDLQEAGRHFDYVITVCDESQEKECPFFPGLTQRLHWSLPDPSSFTGTWDEKMALTRTVRDRIEAEIKEFIRSI